MYPNYFTREGYEDVKLHLESINSFYDDGVETGEFTENDFNPDRIIEVYKTNPVMVKRFLWHFADRHREVNQKYRSQLLAEKNYNDIIEKLEKENKELKERVKAQKEIIKNKTAIVKKLNRLKGLEDECIMREFLSTKKLFVGMEKENLSLMLTKCGFIAEKNSGTERTSSKSKTENFNPQYDFDLEDELEIESKEDNEEENSNIDNEKVISFEDKKIQKSNEVDIAVGRFNALLGTKKTKK
jgi:hypothetical protein